MNERIREIAEQCHHRYSEHNIDLEKFAELIIRECCFTGEQYAEGLIDPCYYAFINKKIKEHFGVEE